MVVPSTHSISRLEVCSKNRQILQDAVHNLINRTHPLAEDLTQPIERVAPQIFNAFHRPSRQLKSWQENVLATCPGPSTDIILIAWSSVTSRPAGESKKITRRRGHTSALY